MGELIKDHSFEDDDDLKFDLSESWNSPFGIRAKEDRIYAAAEAVWAIHQAAIQASTLEYNAPILDEAYQRLIDYKNKLFGELTPEEISRAEMLAQLEIGPVQDPDLSEDTQMQIRDIIIEDSEDARNTLDRKIQEIKASKLNESKE